MNKIISLIMMLLLSISLSAFENLKSLSQLKEHKLIFLDFEKNGCPWCVKYKDELESSTIKKYKTDMKFFKVKKGSRIFSKLRKKFKLKIIIYPMTYIIKLNDNKEPEILHEIYGYQTEEYLEEFFQENHLIK